MDWVWLRMGASTRDLMTCVSSWCDLCSGLEVNLQLTHCILAFRRLNRSTSGRTKQRRKSIHTAHSFSCLKPWSQVRSPSLVNHRWKVTTHQSQQEFQWHRRSYLRLMLGPSCRKSSHLLCRTSSMTACSSATPLLSITHLVPHPSVRLSAPACLVPRRFEQAVKVCGAQRRGFIGVFSVFHVQSWKALECSFCVPSWMVFSPHLTYPLAARVDGAPRVMSPQMRGAVEDEKQKLCARDCWNETCYAYNVLLTSRCPD